MLLIPHSCRVMTIYVTLRFIMMQKVLALCSVLKYYENINLIVSRLFRRDAHTVLSLPQILSNKTIWKEKNKYCIIFSCLIQAVNRTLIYTLKYCNFKRKLLSRHVYKIQIQIFLKTNSPEVESITVFVNSQCSERS